MHVSKGRYLYIESNVHSRTVQEDFILAVKAKSDMKAEFEDKRA
jgi:hypothetical protein